MKKVIFIISGLWIFLLSGNSQMVSVSGIPNHYLKVDEVLSDRVRITQTTSGELVHFTPGDKIMVIQMTGVTIDSSGNYRVTETKTKKAINQTGKFEILQLDEVYMAADTFLIFTHAIANNYNNGEKIQAVKLVEGETVNVDGSITSRSWDGKTGGVVAIIASGTLNLNASIDVSQQGFRGGSVPGEVYTGGCRSDLSPTIKDTLYFLPNKLNRSGNKGEGIINASWPFTKGTAFNINGGGAGNGEFSGGGGGSNYYIGGLGGKQCATCGGYSVLGGWAGYASMDIYLDDTVRVIMGGGGGSGTRMAGATTLSKGGNGGGIIILITDTLRSSSTSVVLKADGENAIATQGSGGGGGAGGSILIDATSFSGPEFGVEIAGGDGGNTTTVVPSVNGAGGGGSGGVFWYSGLTRPTTAIDSSNGAGGTTPGGVSYLSQLGGGGKMGKELKKLNVPLTGFLFNSIRGVDTICSSQVPNQLTASQPKGGTGVYTYSWQQSTGDSLHWIAATGGTNITLRSFQPPALTQTTWYRRIVSSGDVQDTSRMVKIYVYPPISNNNIKGTDTICYQVNALPLGQTSGNITGGDGHYRYQWQYSYNQSTWDNTTGMQPAFDPDALTQSTYYRRLVYSTAYCSSISNQVLITVLESISENKFSSEADTSICRNSSPGLLNTVSPVGGDGTYTYAWQESVSAGEWTALPGYYAVEIPVGVLANTTSFRRIVFSGKGNACIDTSNPKKVVVMPLITNNIIEGAAIRYTCYNTPVQMNGSVPQNGFGAGTYAYQWEQSNDKSTWDLASGTEKDFTSENLTNVRFYRRTVYSTAQLHECSSISEPVEVRINPLPTGNVINKKDTLCAGETLYVKFNVSGNGPFRAVIDGDYVDSQTKEGIAEPLDSIAFTPAVTQNFIILSLRDDSLCYANTAYFKDTVPGIVYPVPEANAGSDAEVCDNSYELHAVRSILTSSGYWECEGVTFTDASEPQCMATTDNYGTKIFSWTESNWHCSDKDEVKVTFFEQPTTPEAGTDQTLDFKYTTQLQAEPASAGRGKWSVISGYAEFSNDTLYDAIVSELENPTRLKWTVTNGNCKVLADSMNLSIHPLQVKKGFTPNGNNKNDYFDFGAASAEKISVKIFSSTGALVYESDNYLEEEYGWDGHNKDGVELPEGTYYYIANIKVEGKEKEVQIRSFVEILR